MSSSGVSEVIKFINLPTHTRSTVSKLPEFSDKEGALYFVDDDDGSPMGIAVSGKDKRIKFYAYMQALEAESVSIDKEYFSKFDADNVQDVLIAMQRNSRVNFERMMSGVII